jgi:hypothetical protein
MMMQLMQLPLLHAAMLRLITTTQLVLSWCTTKSYQYMAARSAGPFLLIIQSDAKVSRYILQIRKNVLLFLSATEVIFLQFLWSFS